MDRRLHGALLLVTLLLCGCVSSSLREVRALEPLYTRRGVGVAPEVTAHCVQDYLEDHFGGRVGRMSGVVYELRQDAGASLLIGRDWASPSAVAFVLSLTPNRHPGSRSTTSHGHIPLAGDEDGRH
jgi:hypothetical protein